MELREQAAPETDCAHRWRIAAPAGAFSKGVCAKCGSERDFANSSDTNGFGDARSTRQ